MNSQERDRTLENDRVIILWAECAERVPLSLTSASSQRRVELASDVQMCKACLGIETSVGLVDTLCTFGASQLDMKNSTAESAL